MTCIKCGKEIPDGELFCAECSLNPSASVFDKEQSGERFPAPKGRMQTPVPVRRAAPQPVMGPMPEDRRRGGSRGLKAALAIVSLLLAAVVGLVAWQYGNFRVQRSRLLVKEADLVIREQELDSLNEEIQNLTDQLDDANTVIADRDLRIQELESQLTDRQSSSSRSGYNP